MSWAGDEARLGQRGEMGGELASAGPRAMLGRSRCWAGGVSRGVAEQACGAGWAEQLSCHWAAQWEGGKSWVGLARAGLAGAERRSGPRRASWASAPMVAAMPK